MAPKQLVATVAALGTAYGAGRAALAADWTVFVDPGHEFSVIMPTPVKAYKTRAGADLFQADDVKAGYSLRSMAKPQMAADQELVAVSDAYVKFLTETNAKNSNPIQVSLIGETSGKNWRGRVFQYSNSTGIPSCFEIAVANRHNFILLVTGATAAAEGPKRFFTSFEVN